MYFDAVNPADYQIFRPDYVASGTGRPVIDGIFGTGPNGEITYGGTYEVAYSGVPQGAWIAKVMLLRPGSVTHHSDGNQRCVQLNMVHKDGNRLDIIMPSLASNILPRGYYMMFLISSQTVCTQGMPSNASWVYVQ